jgi:DNA-binding response OmpR family regulator
LRALVVEDDKKIASFVVNGLRQAGFVVDVAHDGERGLLLALSEPYDVAVVDVMLPVMDGITLIEQLRRQTVNTPVIILSAKRSLDDRIRGLQAGGDDYLVKPFAFSELLARVRALLRRASGGDSGPTEFRMGSLSMNLLSREVMRAGEKLDLQAREFSLLEYLMRNAGRVVSKTMILEHVWGYSFDPQTNVVDVLVCRLRNKIDKNHAVKLIHTIRGVGYVLKET